MWREGKRGRERMWRESHERVEVEVEGGEEWGNVQKVEGKGRGTRARGEDGRRGVTMEVVEA